MQKWIVNFATVVLAVLAALFVFQRLQSPPKADVNVSSSLTSTQQIIRDDATRAMNVTNTAIQEYYSNTGKWPASNEACGLPEPEAFRGKSLTRLDVSGLTVTLTFDAKSGVDGGKVIYTGQSTPQLVMGIQWKCVSPSFPDIGAALPDCTYARP
jgi:Pilin (bacterial filament)